MPSEVPADRWSWSNRLLLWARGTFDARGFNQWKQVGRRVAKGAKAIWILVPMVKMLPAKDDDGNPILDANGEPAKRPRVIGFKTAPVFAYEDTEGEPLPHREAPAPVEPPPLAEVADRLGITVRYEAAGRGGVLGSYLMGRKTIVLHTHDHDTFLHELAHAAHDLVTPGGLAKVDRVFGELVAEGTSAVLLTMSGRTGHEKQAAEYMQSYAARNKESLARAVMRALGDIEKCVKLILGHSDAAPVGVDEAGNADDAGDAGAA